MNKHPTRNRGLITISPKSYTTEHGWTNQTVKNTRKVIKNAHIPAPLANRVLHFHWVLDERVLDERVLDEAPVSIGPAETTFISRCLLPSQLGTAI